MRIKSINTGKALRDLHIESINAAVINFLFSTLQSGKWECVSQSLSEFKLYCYILHYNVKIRYKDDLDLLLLVNII